MRLTFGKHSGEDTSDVPLDYLRWLEEQQWVDPVLREDLNHQIKLRTGDITSVGKVIRVPFSLKLKKEEDD